jgi:hypothetical protein
MAELKTSGRVIRKVLPIAKKSHFINRKPAANAFHAVNVAEILGRPLNYLVTLNFAHTACPPDQVSERFERLRDNHFGPWLRRSAPRGRTEAPPTFVWSIENSGGCLHAHWLVYVPADRVEDFQRRLPIWLEKVTGQVFNIEAAIHAVKAHTPKGAIKYLMKGLDPFYAPAYGIRPVDQGEVIGNRSNFSRCLGPSIKKALQAAGQMKPTRRLSLPRKGAAAISAAR